MSRSKWAWTEGCAPVGVVACGGFAHVGEGNWRRAVARSLLGVVPVASFEHEGIASVVAGGRQTVVIDSGGTIPAEP